MVEYVPLAQAKGAEIQASHPVQMLPDSDGGAVAGLQNMKDGMVGGTHHEPCLPSWQWQSMQPCLAQVRQIAIR
jgi:hypothetical protein